MKKIHFFIVVLLLLSIISCKKYDAQGNLIKDYDELEKANWLVGEWEKTDSLGTLKEIWTEYNDSTYVGESYYIINKKDTIHNEKIELMQTGEHLIYSATIKGENNDEPIPYQMTTDEDSLVVFENPKYPYPAKIEYNLKKNNGIQTTISGKQNGKASSETYVLARKK